MRLFILFFALFFAFGCTRTTEDLQVATAVDYFPVSVGKYRTYRTDSTVFLNFGSITETHSYQEKHLVDAEITDGSGKPAFRIQRLIRNANATTEPWKASGYYTITVGNALEVVENNLRIIKLVSPVETGIKWKGNAYLSTDPYLPLFKFDLIREFGDWMYEYQTTGETMSLSGKTFNDVVTVAGVDESFNVPIMNLQQFGYKKYDVEKYAKDVGLIYQDLQLWEYQPNTKYIGFGVKRTLIDYN